MIPTGSTYFALENEALKTEIKQLTLKAIQMKLLCARAAEALEHADWSTDYDDRWAHSELIVELRKAAE